MKISEKQQQRAALTESDPRWASVLARDPAAEGAFYYAVSTTGVYCRPTCPSRLARPAHVSFFAAREEAERAGFRPCKRCKSDQPSQAERYRTTVTEACRMIEESEQVPSLAALAMHAGISTFHFHRLFKAATGLTPKEYANAHRANRVRSGLERNGTVTEAIYGAGFNSNGRFYEASNEMLGMTPSAYRAGGVNTDIHFALGECSLGSILVAKSTRGICAISLGDDPDVLAKELQDRFPNANLIGGDARFEQWISRVVGFIEAPGIGLDLPLDVRGTAFQQRVWQALREIPIGTTASYAEIARRIGSPDAARAVAQACASNALAVVIPCHRVVRNDGQLSGYRWGVERKRALIDREQRA
jgi:AraC family transcriptional regulator of adaptative response/methylated-DNA-[protein]-cysteine methyltransferase